MDQDSSSSAPRSGQTSASAAAAPHLSESEFLARQAADAKAAISHVIDEIKNDLAKGADPRGWVQVAPWTSLGVAAAAGFVAAAAMIPSKEDQALKRLRKIEEALSPHRGNGHAEPVDSNNPKGVAAATSSKSFLSQLAGQVLHAIQPVLISTLTAGVTAKAAQPDQPAAGVNPGEAAYGPASTPPPGPAPEI
jgi:hypothetical protein